MKRFLSFICAHPLDCNPFSRLARLRGRFVMRLPHQNQKSRNVINSLNDNITDGFSCTLRQAILAAKNAPANAG